MSNRTIVKTDIHHFLKGCAFHIIKHDQRSVDLLYANIIENHSFHFFRIVFDPLLRRKRCEGSVDILDKVIKHLKLVVRDIIFHLCQSFKKSKLHYP